MLPALTRSACPTCRLRALIAAKQFARSRGGLTAHFHTAASARAASTQPRKAIKGRPATLGASAAPIALSHHLDAALPPLPTSGASSSDHLAASHHLAASDHLATSDRLATCDHLAPSAENAAREAWRAFGHALPHAQLNDEEYRIYERLYGPPVSRAVDLDASPGDAEIQGELDEEADLGTGLLREGPDGRLEEVNYLPEDALEDEGLGENEETLQGLKAIERLEKTKKGRFFTLATKAELDATVLAPRLSKSDEASMVDVNDEWEAVEQTGKSMYLNDVRYLKLERWLQDSGELDEADELVKHLYLRYVAAARETAEAHQLELDESADILQESFDEDLAGAADEEQDGLPRAHPLTLENRFATSPTTLQLPKSTFTDPISILLSGMPQKHLSDSAHRVFGGPGLPYSTSNPSSAKTKQQKPIPLDPYQGRMSDVDADIYMAAIMPGVYASVTGVMVETRKRLGSAWLENMMTKEGGPRILDAGGAGAGVLAVREVLRAEWQRMHDMSDDKDAVRELAPAGGQTGGAPIPAPFGKASVLTASDALRQRASTLLENTAFLPRLPDYVHAADESAKDRGKFDIIIAPHTLWPLKEDYLRKQHLANLWSLLSTDGGVLILLEKGVPRGFEMIAAAREMLLETRIASPGREHQAEELTTSGPASPGGFRRKERGMIIAPCTNHSGCPMYTKAGVSKGRKDYCHFEQRFIRPPFLQKLLGAKDRNHEDVPFSYISVMRGRDLRDKDEGGLVQGEQAADRAFAGFEDLHAEQHHVDPEHASTFDPTAPALPDVDDVYGDRDAGPHSLALPRLILPPLKRTGHVIMDLCTPAGAIERWTVPKSFSKQAFRDARKSAWGDLWALGAKTRVARTVRLGGDAAAEDGEKRGVVKGMRKEGVNQRKTKAKNVVEVGYDSEGRIKEEDVKLRTGGRMRQGKVKGIRDKRDKQATGRGRRKEMMGE